MENWKQWILRIGILLMIAIGSLISIGYVRYQSLIMEAPLQQVVASIRTNPNFVSLKDIDDDFLTAILAIEDPTFYTHDGIVLSNIVEALCTNIKEKSLVMGGSTITQQLSKNIYLDQKKTFQRKIAELFFVHDLESQYSKSEILELYLNVIYFGDGYYGIKEACNGYFHKHPKDIDIAQATLLAGLPQAPAIYQLSDGMTFAKKRQRIVLQAMEEQNILTNEQSLAIYNQPV